jgi:osmotically-inducible protein OsmY
VIARTAKDKLRTNPYRAIRAVSCECDRGELLLRGQLSSFFHKQLAQEAVADIEGITQVVNEIEVITPIRGVDFQGSSSVILHGAEPWGVSVTTSSHE